MGKVTTVGYARYLRASGLWFHVVDVKAGGSAGAEHGRLLEGWDMLEQTEMAMVTGFYVPFACGGWLAMWLMQGCDDPG